MNSRQEARNQNHRLVLIDELSLYRRGVAELIARQEGLAVSGESSDRNGAFSALESIEADLVVMELSARDGAGVDLIKDLRLRHSRLRILVLSQYPEAIHAERVLQAGASGFVSKFESDAVILEAIRCVLEGRTYFSAKVSAQLALRYLGVGVMEPASPIQGLTNRELQVFRLIGATHSRGRGRAGAQCQNHRDLSGTPETQTGCDFRGGSDTPGGSMDGTRNGGLIG